MIIIEDYMIVLKVITLTIVLFYPTISIEGKLMYLI